MGRFSHIDERAKGERWVERIRASDERALSDIVRACYPGVASFAYRYTRSKETAEEVAQDVFIRLWDRRATLQISGSLTAYLFTAARNAAINATSRASERLLSAAADETETESLHSGVGAGDMDLDAHELSRAIRTALDALPPRTREVFLLSRRDGLTPAQIAHVLGVNVQTVYTLLGRALKELQKAV